ncbi:MAG: ParB/RepB/Spo0J family partition protein [Planctomycetota bacterium]
MSVKNISCDAIATTTNHREKGKDRRLDELKKSIQRNGLLQPIGVRDIGKGQFELVFGHRRLAACIELGLDQIAATVLNVTDGGASAVQASENLDRAPVSAIEEATAVANLIEAAKREQGDLEEDQLIAFAAERSGRSPRWIRDRLYLTRLSAASRSLVHEGRLGIEQARTIAQLADPAARDEVAKYAAKTEEGLGGYTVNEVRRAVGARLNNLKLVPWRLDVMFAGKPACDTCPSNSANDATLFEGGDDPKQPVCTNRKCFDAKRTSAERSLDAAVVKLTTSIGKKKPEDRPPLTEKGLADACPKAVRIGTFVRRAKRQLDPSKPAAASRATRAVSSDVEAIRKGRNDYWNADRKWHEEVQKLCDDTAKAHPHFAFVLLLCDAAVDGQDQWGKQRDKQSAKAAKIASEAMSVDPSELWTWLTTHLAKDVGNPPLQHLAFDIGEAMLRHLDVDVPAKPVEADFIAAAKAKLNKPAAKKKQAKTTAQKTVRRKKVTKKKAKTSRKAGAR